ncbi:uncharacterized protein LOC124927793 [Impatiens glandulifera]|uniref:uncharacterized protein LOC124927793 n=1 Tax=Impatiens glandulifera TaxID=253017 RepID=UPI001FB0ED3E|nr:uncharacterized protein LOC124927793 [Impatiens glandulifera]
MRSTVLQGQDLWPIRKTLTSSDVDVTHPFLTLSRQAVEDHILIHFTPFVRDHLRNTHDVTINVHDDDTGDKYLMKLKWRVSYYNLIGKWGKVIRGKGLGVGNEIMIRWVNGWLHFSVPQELNVGNMPPMQTVSAPPHPVHWPIKKVLTLSDIDTNHPFLPLPQRPVDEYILVHLTQHERECLRNDEQVDMNARDDDTGEIYQMKLKWRGNSYNLIGKWGKIIRKRGLGVGKEIKICWWNKCLHFSIPQEQFVAVNPGLDYWPIRKALTLSDIDTNHPFLTLPGKAVENNILLLWTLQDRDQLRNERQLTINAQDYDTGDFHTMKLRWRGSYYNLVGKWGKLVREKGLTIGREIKLRWEHGCLFFSFQI